MILGFVTGWSIASVFSDILEGTELKKLSWEQHSVNPIIHMKVVLMDYEEMALVKLIF